MGVITKPYTFVAGGYAYASEVNADFDALYNLVNGNLSADNLATSAVTESKVAAGAITLPKLGVGVKSLIQDKNITGSAVQNIDFEALTTYEMFELDVNVYNPTAGIVSYYMYINTDYTPTNYYRQVLTISGTAVTAVRQNEPTIIALPSGHTAMTQVWLRNVKSDVGYATPRGLSFQSRQVISVIEFEMLAWGYISAAQISSIRIGASVAGGIGAGSRVRLYGK